MFHVPGKTKNLLPWIRTQVYLGRITGDRSKILVFGNVITDPKHTIKSMQAVLQTGHLVIVDVEVDVPDLS